MLELRIFSSSSDTTLTSFGSGLAVLTLRPPPEALATSPCTLKAFFTFESQPFFFFRAGAGGPLVDPLEDAPPTGVPEGVRWGPSSPVS